MPCRRRRLLLWGLLPALACGWLAYLRVMPTNISRTDYEQALNKWQAHAVQEYEIEGNLLCYCDDGDFRVRVVNNKIDPTHSTIAAHALNTRNDVDQEYGFLTVAGQFAMIPNLLTPHITGSKVYTNVTFDPVLGYPNHSESHAQLGTLITDVSVTYSVTHLTILKAGP